jgi:hypothetical protein
MIMIMIMIMPRTSSFSQMNLSAANRIGHHSMEPGGVAYCRAAAGSKDEIQPAEILLE